MRCAILADIHSNLEAFSAVLEHLNRSGGFDRIWCLGDVVGYGPDPGACIELLSRYDHICVAGNHDWACTGRVSTSDFNPIAAQACEWTASQLGDDGIEYLNNLPESIIEGDFTLVHGSPRQPLWEYVLSTGMAAVNMDYFDTEYCLMGHSHVSLVYLFDESAGMCKDLCIDDGGSYVLDKRRAMINPGGVGQPRDGDPRASYMLYETGSGTITHHRVAYDYSETQAKMTRHKLPDLLIERLAYGY